MSVPQWIGLVFGVALVVFMMVAFFKQKDLTSDQRNMMKFFAALCAGFCSAFFVGGAVLTGNVDVGVADFALTGSAGFAAFFGIWFTYERTIPPAWSASVGDGWGFAAAAEKLAGIEDASVEFVGFSQEQLATPLRKGQVNGKTLAAALKELRLLGSGIPPYGVSAESPSHYRFVAKEGG